MFLLTTPDLTGNHIARAPSLDLREPFLFMRVLTIDVFVERGVIRAATERMLERAALFAMAACLTGDVRVMKVANRRLEMALAYSLSVERILGPPEAGSYE